MEPFTKIYNEYKVLVYNVALHYLQNIQDAEEVTQDVFVKVYYTLHSFQGKASLKTWIYKITINQSLDFLKKKKSKKRLFIFGNKSHNEQEIVQISNFEHPGIILEKKEDAALLFAIINTLPEHQKTAFILSKIDGLSNPEIAEIMETSISAIESLIFRAKTTLKERISDKFESYRKKK
ncbi:RNA polymerase sigma factor [Flavobacterium sp. J27]|uniref:RNA polymerase sigma factor n=1 Tax=Flavobacterium sp. J27 TaxID=2060419 RepID=UPI001030C299